MRIAPRLTDATRLIAMSSLLLASILNASAASAQQVVSGTVVESGSEKSVEGAMVVLLADGQIVARSLSSANGSFRMTAPRPGRYELRVDRIGYSSTLTEAFAVEPSGTAIEHRIETGVRPVALRGLDVLGDRRCEVRPSGGVTATVWEEARKALEAARWTSDRELYRFAWIRFVREINADGDRITDEERTRRRHFAPEPFKSVDPDVLASEGFVSERDGRLYYAAPDAAVLLSEPFLDGHCFEIERAEEEDRPLLGLRFTPIRGSRLPDVAGVLWLDAETGLLRSLDYEYVNLRRAVAVRGDDASGQLRFRALPNGTWIVDEWSIRMPRLTEVRDTEGRPRRYDVRGYIEEGGSISQVENTTGVILTLGQSGLRGTVSDSLGRPAEGASVRIVGTDMEARTGVDGTFEMADVGPGTWLVRTSHPTLATYGYEGTDLEVTLARDDLRALELDLPSLNAWASDRCPLPTGEVDPGMVLLGRVLHPDGTPAPDAAVRVTWSEVRGTRRVFDGLGTEADSIGVFTLCHIPDERRLSASAWLGEGEADPVRLEASEESGVISIDLTLRSADAEAPEVPDALIDDLGADRPWLDSLGFPLRSDEALLHLSHREILALGVDSLPQIWSRIPRVEHRLMQNGGAEFRLHPDENRPPTPAEDRSCSMEMYLNGSLVRYRMDPSFGLALENRLLPRDLTAIEIYDGAEAPVGTSDSCGAILLWVDLVRHRDDPDFTGTVRGRLGTGAGMPGDVGSVRLQPGNIEVTPDAEGFFDFGRLPPAEYVVEARLPEWGVWSAPVQLRAWSTIDVVVDPSSEDADGPGLAVIVDASESSAEEPAIESPLAGEPSIEESLTEHAPAPLTTESLRREYCGDQQPGAALVAGRVVDADTGTGVMGASVEIRWEFSPGIMDWTGVRRDFLTRTRVTTGESGSYLVCDVPAPSRVWLTPSVNGVAGEPVAVDVSREGAVIRDIVVR